MVLSQRWSQCKYTMIWKKTLRPPERLHGSYAELLIFGKGFQRWKIGWAARRYKLGLQEAEQLQTLLWRPNVRHNSTKHLRQNNSKLLSTFGAQLSALHLYQVW